MHKDNIKTQFNLSTSNQISYSMVMTEKLLDCRNSLLTTFLPATQNRRCLIFLDYGAAQFYHDPILQYFSHHKIVASIVVCKVSEEKKTIEKTLEIIQEFEKFNPLRRSEPIFIIGGGILLDIVGFASSIYRRGIPFIRIPTTLVSFIDSAIGIKCGVNYSKSKNRIGTYNAPQKVLLDPLFLKTLPELHIRNGMAEIFKIALVKDQSLFKILEYYGHEVTKNNFPSHPKTEEILCRAIVGMIEELQPNLFENTLNRLVDFGHTFSPHIEMSSHHEFLHGEAVSMDMALTVAISKNRGLIDEREFDRIFSTFKLLNLPLVWPKPNPIALFDSLKDIVKHRDGRLRLPLLTGIASVSFVDDITLKEICSAIDCTQLHLGNYYDQYNTADKKQMPN